MERESVLCPAAWFELCDATGAILPIKVYEVAKEVAAHNHEAGTLLTDGKKYAKVAVKGGYISLLSVQIPGKKRMPIGDLLRGFSMQGCSINR